MTLEQAIDELHITDNKVLDSKLTKYPDDIYDELIDYFLQNNIEIIYDSKEDEKFYSTDIVKQHLIDIGYTPLLPKETLTQLFMKFTNEGDLAARAKIIESNMRLVVSIAKRYNRNEYAFLDVIQDGYLGLIKAVDKFDYNLGYSLSTYATHWIKQSISAAIGNKSKTIRIPLNRDQKLKELRRIISDLSNIFGREPTIKEISDRLNISEESIYELFKDYQLQEIASLNQPINDEESSSLGEVIIDENGMDPESEIDGDSLKDSIKDILKTLTPRERRIVELRFGLADGTEYTLEEVGKEFNVTRERIRQIEAKALRKLRRPSNSRKLKDFV